MTMKVNLLQGYILVFILSQSLLRVERIVVPTRIRPSKVIILLFVVSENLLWTSRCQRNQFWKFMSDISLVNTCNSIETNFLSFLRNYFGSSFTRMNSCVGWGLKSMILFMRSYWIGISKLLMKKYQLTFSFN